MTTHHQRILELLDSYHIQYKTIHHEETPTSQDSARVRGEELSHGGKALVLKYRENSDSEQNQSGFAVFVLSASRTVDTKCIKKEFKSKNIRFASSEELASLTGGLPPGAVPPFGRPIVQLDLFVDTSIEENEIIAYNCGSLTDSVIMRVTDYLMISCPNKVFSFSK